MKIISADEMAARLDFVSPINPPEEQKLGVYCIPFEYGDSRKGTRISVAKAREIVAELRAAVAEAEHRLLREAFEDEKRRTAELERHYREVNDRRFELEREVAELKSKLLKSNKLRGKRRGQ